MIDIRESKRFVFFTGAMGTQLQEKGISPEELRKHGILHPEIITEIHEELYRGWSEVLRQILLGLIGINIRSQGRSTEEIIKAGVENAKKARKKQGIINIAIAFDVGPTGRLMAPMGEMKFEEAVSVFAETIRYGVKYGVDLILIETMNDLFEAKAAVLAAKENSELPVWVTCVFNENARMLTGSDPMAMVA
jgi:5-methyltetrahydrofolate--homocysteine methyltransferase